MKKIFFLPLFILIILILKENPLAQQTSDKREVLRGILFNATPLSQESERIINEIREAYKVNAFERVVRLHQSLSPWVQLSPEEILIIAESYFATGNLEKASELAERAISLRRGTEIACKGSFLKVKSLYLLGREKESLKELSALEEGFCKDLLGEKLRVFKSYLTKKDRETIHPKILNSFLKEILEAKLNFYLKKGFFREAEREIFDYLNLTGEYRKGKDYFYKLAEAYFERGEILKAKKYYQLIITEWDPSKESFLAKFRLYQMAYERATIKELLPPKTIEDLLLFILQIKSKYPEEKIAEEASFLEIKIYFEKKDWDRARQSAKEFFQRYEESAFYPKVRNYFCNASFDLVPDWFKKGKIKELQKIADSEKDLFKRLKCGDFYYALGSMFLGYNLYTPALYYLLSTYELDLSQELWPDYYLKLAFLALEKSEIELARLLLQYLQKNWGGSLKEKPEARYLEAYFALNKDLNFGLKYLHNLLNSNLPSYYKKKLLYQAFQKAIEANKFSIARSLLQNPNYEPTIEDYLILLTTTFDKDPKFFEDFLREAKAKFPKNEKLLFLEAYYLERKGDFKGSLVLWEKLEQAKAWEGKLSQSYERLQKLSERARKLVY